MQVFKKFASVVVVVSAQVVVLEAVVSVQAVVFAVVASVRDAVSVPAVVSVTTVDLKNLVIMVSEVSASVVDMVASTTNRDANMVRTSSARLFIGAAPLSYAASQTV